MSGLHMPAAFFKSRHCHLHSAHFPSRPDETSLHNPGVERQGRSFTAQELHRGTSVISAFCSIRNLSFFISYLLWIKISVYSAIPGNYENYHIVKMVSRIGTASATKIQIPSPTSAVHEHLYLTAVQENGLCLHKFIRLLRPISLFFSI